MDEETRSIFTAEFGTSDIVQRKFYHSTGSTDDTEVTQLQGQQSKISKCSTILFTMTFILLSLPLSLSVVRLALLIELLKDSFGEDTPPPGSETLLQSQFGYLMDILVQVGHILEYVALMSGYTIFLLNLRKCHEGEQSINADILNILKPSSYYNTNPIRTMLVISGILAVITIHTAVSLTPPSLLLVWREEIIHSYKLLPHIAMPYSAMVILTHIMNVITGSAMIIATAIVITLWREGHSVLGQNNDRDDRKAKFNKLIHNYHKTGKSIALIQTIFEGWFVAYWTTYFFRIMLDVTNTVKSLTSNDFTIERIQISYIGAHLLYDIFNLSLTYACGQLMNSHHWKYYKLLLKQQREILKEEESQSGFYLQCANIIPKEHAYQFLPSFCGFSIPLDNLGYLLTISLAIFAIITRVTIDYVDP